jgi:topoisomerase-4 subunit A
MATNIPPHNIDELVGACLHLIKSPNARDETLLDFVQGPDFPTGGIIIEPRAAIKDAYRTGKGGFRLRARWAVEDLGRGTWQVVVTEIPYQVQKGKLIERIAELVNAKKIPILADVRDESAEDVRIVLEPRARTVDPAVMMEMLFKQSDLETRFAMNMNVLIDGRTPQVCSLKEVLRAFLDHRRDVLLRRSRFQLEKIDARLEVLEGLLVAYLNLDRIIAIIRFEDEPKAVMMAEFALSDVQAEAILNMRLRNLRRLEEMEIRAERDVLTAERAGLAALLASEDAQWARIAEELRAVRKAFGKDALGGARRTGFDDAPEVEEVAYEAMIEREPLTVVCSAMGWIRAMKGHLDPAADLKFKDGDGPGFFLHAETTDRLLLFSSNGRTYTLACATLPGGRGMGEPVRLMVDLPNEAAMLALFIHVPGRRLMVVSEAGDGFILPEDEAVAQTRAGRQVLNLRPGARARVCRPVSGDHVAVVGENRKMLIFSRAELPEMGRGKGVRLQRYKDGGLSDALTFDLNDGLTWKDPAGRTRTVSDLAEWMGARASAGRMAPRGFPRDLRFD